jgi:pimeloyl-ACP methyl ester carboxylesterase
MKKGSARRMKRGTMRDEVEQFRIEFAPSELTDLRDRLTRTRWPEKETVDDWSQGVPLAYLRELCGYWADGYDWPATQARLNELPHFRTTLDGLGVHFVHVRSPYADALPLVITHGWPGSIIEFEKVLGPLSDPVAFGGDAADAFHVVCPSLPGYGFSDKPAGPGWNVQRIASAWATLMARLGYSRYGAQGGDWGNSITTCIGQQDLDHVVGIHLNPPIVAPDPETFGDLTDQERSARAALEHARDWESGYSEEQATKPQTVGYALVDSPVGLCAWIVEKFWSWTDCDGDLDNVLTRDEVLDDVTLYWLTATGASSARLYWESIRQVSEWFTRSNSDTVAVPTGCSIFPKEVIRPSRRWAAKRYTDIRQWHELEKGGHFAAFEQPEVFVDEVRAFFRQLR